jgi:isochorismate synthase
MQEQTNLFVNLRCCEIENYLITIYVGCGITKDSQAEKEFIETENKAKTILSVLIPL